LEVIGEPSFEDIVSAVVVHLVNDDKKNHLTWIASVNISLHYKTKTMVDSIFPSADYLRRH